jgi:hypothetical protein
MYHGLARRYLIARGLLMRPQLNSGTLAGPREEAEVFKTDQSSSVAETGELDARRSLIWGGTVGHFGGEHRLTCASGRQGSTRQRCSDRTARALASGQRLLLARGETTTGSVLPTADTLCRSVELVHYGVPPQPERACLRLAQTLATGRTPSDFSEPEIISRIGPRYSRGRPTSCCSRRPRVGAGWAVVPAPVGPDHGRFAAHILRVY